MVRGVILADDLCAGGILRTIRLPGQGEQSGCQHNANRVPVDEKSSPPIVATRSRFLISSFTINSPLLSLSLYPSIHLYCRNKQLYRDLGKKRRKKGKSCFLSLAIQRIWKSTGEHSCRAFFHRLHSWLIEFYRATPYPRYSLTLLHPLFPFHAGTCTPAFDYTASLRGSCFLRIFQPLFVLTPTIVVQTPVLCRDVCQRSNVQTLRWFMFYNQIHCVRGLRFTLYYLGLS